MEKEVSGFLAEVVDQKKVSTAYVVGHKGKRLRVLLPTGKETTFSSSQTLLLSRKRYPNLSRNEAIELVREKDELRENLKREVNLRELWELVLGEAEEFDPYELAELYFGDSAGDDHAAALLRAVLEEKLYFRIRDGRLVVHSEEEVERFLHARKKEEERLRRLSLGEEFLGALLSGSQVPDRVPDEVRAHFLEGLKELCLFGEKTQKSKETKEVLERLKATSPEVPFRLLVKAGVFHEDENLELLRFNIPVEFPERVLEELPSLRERELEREDLTELYTFTVDAEETKDFDDALHFEEKEDRFVVGVHIADVASVVGPETALFRAARRRGTTLYLPERIIPMLPPELSEERLSLREGERKNAVSFFLEFSKEGELLSQRIVPSVIRVKKRFTYEEVDRLIEEGDPLFKTLYEVARKFFELRKSKGAVAVLVPEVVVRVREDGEIEVKRLEFTPARLLVAEFMIAANYAAAKTLYEAGVPAIYRFQKEPLERVEGALDGDLVKAFLQLRYLVRGEHGLSPEFHHGIGLPFYTTVTSPIRRFLDLVVQHQLLAHLSGSPPPFNEESLKELLMDLEELQAVTSQVKSKTHRYWLLKYLKRHYQGRRTLGIVIEAGERRAKVLLTEFMLPVELQLPPSRSVRLGEELVVLITRVNPRLDVVKVALG